MNMYHDSCRVNPIPCVCGSSNTFFHPARYANPIGIICKKCGFASTQWHDIKDLDEVRSRWNTTVLIELAHRGIEHTAGYKIGENRIEV